MSIEDVLDLDGELVRAGFEEGRRKGESEGEREGLQLGRRKGAEVGVRLAVYDGRLGALRTLLERHADCFPPRAVATIEQAERSLAEAREGVREPQSEAGFEALEGVETKLKLLDSLLKLSSGAAHASDGLDF